MNLFQVARLMAGFVGVFTLAQLPAFISALAETAHPSLSPSTGFGVSIAVGSVVTILLWLCGRRDRTQIFRKETIAVAGLSYFLAGMMGAIPFFVSGLLSNPVDAYFEDTGFNARALKVRGDGPGRGPGLRDGGHGRWDGDGCCADRCRSGQRTRHSYRRSGHPTIQF